MKTAVLIDGGALRIFARDTDASFSGDFVEDFAHNLLTEHERLLRILYYDAPRFDGSVALPVSGGEKAFVGGNRFLADLAERDRFAVRLGSLAFRGWRLSKRFRFEPGAAPTDGDFDPIFEQKGVDMRIGLDIANFAERRSVDRLILVSADSDMVAALKYARRAGLEVGVAQLPPPAARLPAPLLVHSDFVRMVG